MADLFYAGNSLFIQTIFVMIFLFHVDNRKPESITQENNSVSTGTYVYLVTSNNYIYCFRIWVYSHVYHWFLDSASLPSDPCNMHNKTTAGFGNGKPENISGKNDSALSIKVWVENFEILCFGFLWARKVPKKKKENSYFWI